VLVGVCGRERSVNGKQKGRIRDARKKRGIQGAVELVRLCHSIRCTLNVEFLRVVQKRTAIDTWALCRNAKRIYTPDATADFYRRMMKSNSGLFSCIDTFNIYSWDSP